MSQAAAAPLTHTLIVAVLAGDAEEAAEVIANKGS